MDRVFVVTPWRSHEELFQVRRDFYSASKGGDDDAVAVADDGTSALAQDRRQQAVDKVYAWRARKAEIPLLLESTADIVAAVLQDERGGLGHEALRLVYGGAIARFVTALSDTKTHVARSIPPFFPPDQTVTIPRALRETRHAIVHRHLPSLAELKLAARESLAWLWDWYWSCLDHAFDARHAGRETLNEEEARGKLQSVLKTYVKSRKNEIKSRTAKTSQAVHERFTASSAAATTACLNLRAPLSLKRAILLTLLIDDAIILPAARKLGTSMSGAFLVWDPLLLSLSQAMTTRCDPFVQELLDRMTNMTSSLSLDKAPTDLRSAAAAVKTSEDSIREAFHEWSVHVCTSTEWQDLATDRVVEHVIEECLTAPAYWTLKLAAQVLEDRERSGNQDHMHIDGSETGSAEEAQHGERAGKSRWSAWRELLDAATTDAESHAATTPVMHVDGMFEPAEKGAIEVVEGQDERMQDTDDAGKDGADEGTALDDIVGGAQNHRHAEGPRKVTGPWTPRHIGSLSSRRTLG